MEFVKQSGEKVCKGWPLADAVPARVATEKILSDNRVNGTPDYILVIFNSVSKALLLYKSPQHGSCGLIKGVPETTNLIGKTDFGSWDQETARAAGA